MVHEDAFWLVWNWNSNSNMSKQKHTDEQSAAEEARRLARELMGSKFYVLRVVKGFQALNVETINIVSPF